MTKQPRLFATIAVTYVVLGLLTAFVLPSIIRGHIMAELYWRTILGFAIFAGAIYLLFVALGQKFKDPGVFALVFCEVMIAFTMITDPTPLIGPYASPLFVTIGGSSAILFSTSLVILFREFRNFVPPILDLRACV